MTNNIENKKYISQFVKNFFEYPSKKDKKYQRQVVQLYYKILRGGRHDSKHR